MKSIYNTPSYFAINRKIAENCEGIVASQKSVFSYLADNKLMDKAALAYDDVKEMFSYSLEYYEKPEKYCSTLVINKTILIEKIKEAVIKIESMPILPDVFIPIFLNWKEIHVGNPTYGEYDLEKNYVPILKIKRLDCVLEEQISIYLKILETCEIVPQLYKCLFV